MKPLGSRQVITNRQATVRFRGRRYAVAEANALAVREFSSQNFTVALEIYDLIVAKLPDYAEAYNNRGAILQQLKRYREALANYDRAAALKPRYANVHFNRGSTLNKLKRYEEALASFDRAVALKPDHVEAFHNRGVALQELRRYSEALASYDQVLVLKPDHAEACNNRGLVLTNLGEMQEAEKMFLKASYLKPDFCEPLFNLTVIQKYTNQDQVEAKQIRGLLEKPGISKEDRETLCFSLGKILDDCSEYDEAFEFYRQANQIRNAAVSYNPSKVEDSASGIIEVFNRDFLAGPFAFASDSQVPVFIVGMPRSGTTLLAGILSNHPSIASAGELSTMTDYTSRFGEISETGATFPQAVRHLTGDAGARLIKLYLEHLRRGVSSGVPLVIDKNPLNFANIGLISKLFPGAHIIHCTRHPMDTALSTYFQRFPLDLDYAFDLWNIGHFYAQYVRLMEHWRRLTALKMIEVSYEDMVLNTEPTVRRTLDFLGLPWDERCLAPHTNPYAVETASRWQVRQPIYRHSLGRWRHYEQHLAPLKEALFTANIPF